MARVHPAGAGGVLPRPRTDGWPRWGGAALRDAVPADHAQLTAQVLARTGTDKSASERVDAWEEEDQTAVSRAVDTLVEICAEDRAELARLSVGLRVVRTLLRSA